MESTPLGRSDRYVRAPSPLEPSAIMHEVMHIVEVTAGAAGRSKRPRTASATAASSSLAASLLLQKRGAAPGSNEHDATQQNVWHQQGSSVANVAVAGTYADAERARPAMEERMSLAEVYALGTAAAEVQQWLHGVLDSVATSCDEQDEELGLPRILRFFDGTVNARYPSNGPTCLVRTIKGGKHVRSWVAGGSHGMPAALPRLDAWGRLLVPPSEDDAVVNPAKWRGASTGCRSLVVDPGDVTRKITDYRSIRFPNDVVSVGDTVYLMPDHQYDFCEIGLVKAMFEVEGIGDKYFEIQWFFRPEHVENIPATMRFAEHEIFATEMSDFVLADQFEGKVAILQLSTADPTPPQSPHQLFARYQYVAQGADGRTLLLTDYAS